jgi:hypothetical protein
MAVVGSQLVAEGSHGADSRSVSRRGQGRITPQHSVFRYCKATRARLPNTTQGRRQSVRPELSWRTGDYLTGTQGEGVTTLAG